METILKINSRSYTLERYPKTEDKTLKAWSNAELLCLEYIKGKEFNTVHVYNDRFGFWNCVLQDKEVITIWNYASQQKAIKKNLHYNGISKEVYFSTPLDSLNGIKLALIKIPKSLELFELYLQQIQKCSNEHTEVICSFMTKYFSSSFLKIAESYFDIVEQTKAWKKARLLILKNPKKIIKSKSYINAITYKEKNFKQWFGVFSSGSIDIGTQFFLENLKVSPKEVQVLDLACGNGVIGATVLAQNEDTKLTFIDDFNLAVESSKMNVDVLRSTFICDNNLESLEKHTFDLVVSNPPFHFEYENNIEVSLNLFKEVFSCLKKTGRFVLVANKHLNYKTHLIKLFRRVVSVAENKKFIIYECYKE
ncbi:Ribosomal RNA large subunit methyltransferase G [Tenacibaculum sp. 190524A02b]|uniref:23S rRNA (Guanine1835-N2)-methyltransferase n=1 Tax=Tenacibaculum vairaonense TaxID=3137860 RepID=A0ABM9PHI1_9FLAO